MSSLSVLDFPDTQISKDPEQANYENYLAWQAQHAKRRRESGTGLNRFQGRSAQRMCANARYKESSEKDSAVLKDMVERRLSRACDCEDCYVEMKEKSSSDDSSVPPLSPTSSVRSSMSLLSATTSVSTSPPGTVVRPATSISSRNSLIVSPPPRSRHHNRTAKSVPAN